MTTVTFDEERYRREVLEPARQQGDRPPADLFARYALGEAQLLSDAAFRERLKDVVGYWGRLGQQSRVYGTLVRALVAGHHQLAASDDLTRPALRDRRQRDLQKAREELRRGIDGLSRSYTCVHASVVEGFVERAGGLLDANDVGAAMRSVRLNVVALQPLPQGPAPPAAAKLRRDLNVLGRRLSPEVVFDEAVRSGFQLRDGFRLTTGTRAKLDEEAIRHALTRVDRTAHDERHSAAGNVLALLQREARRPGGIAALVRWEVLEQLRGLQLTRQPQRALSQAAVELGLDRDEADVLSLSLIEAGTTPGDRVRAEDVRAAIAQGQLRRAERLVLVLVGPEQADLRGQIRDLGERVADIERRARLLGPSEEAVGLLEAAMRIAADDEHLNRQLLRIPPPAPTGITAVVDGAAVTLSWQRSAVRTGKVTYRVSRVEGAGASTELHVTEGNELTDHEPPAGVSLRYRVRAMRDGGDPSAVVTSDALILLPDVRDLRIEAGTRNVIGSWHLPAGAIGAVMRRARDRPPAAAQEWTGGDLHATGFVDRAVDVGTLYGYRVSAVYGGHGTGYQISPGVIAMVRPEPAPTAVVDLEAAQRFAADTAVVELTWTAPPTGEVTILRSRREPVQPPGTIIARPEPPDLGDALSQDPVRTTGGRMSVALPLPPGRWFFVPLTRNSAHAVLGVTATLSTAAAVRNLTAERLEGDVVQFGWEWPDGSVAAHIRWAPYQGGDGQEGEVTHPRHRYRTHGGFQLSLGRAAATVTVQALAGEADAATSAPVAVDVAAARPQVSYWLQPMFRGRRRIFLEADVACTIPDLVVVQRPGRARPAGPGDGEVVAAIATRTVVPKERITVDFDLGRIRRPWRLICLPAVPGSAPVVLVQRSAAHLSLD